jgi:hypothetical protein
MVTNNSFFVQNVGRIHKSGFLNPTHATELTVLEDRGGLIETFHYYGNTLQLSEIKQRTDRLHQVHCGVAYIARSALNLVAALTIAPIGALYNFGRCLQTQDERAASLKGLKYDCAITAAAFLALGMGYAGIKYFRSLLQYDPRLILIVAIFTAIPAGAIASFRPYHGQDGSALAAYLLFKHFGLVQANGYPLSYNPNQDNETWTFDAEGTPEFPEYEDSVLFRQWVDARDHIIIAFRDVMGRDLDFNEVLPILKKADFQTLRQMAVDKGKDVTCFDEALRHYEMAWRMNVEMGKQCLTSGDPTSMNEDRRGWGYPEVERFFGLMRTGIFKYMDEEMQNLLQPPPNPLEPFKTQLAQLNLDQANEKAKTFILRARDLCNENLELDDLRAELKGALCAATEEDVSRYNSVKRHANLWFHPDKNTGWNDTTKAQTLYKAIIKFIDTGTIG